MRTWDNLQILRAGWEPLQRLDVEDWCFQAHLKIVEKSSEQALLIGMDYLLNISFVSDDEIFKICLDYWNFFVPSIYSAVQISSGFSNGAFPGFGSSHVLENSRKRLYSQVLSRLRLLMITRMAKPEEVRNQNQHLLMVWH